MEVLMKRVRVRIVIDGYFALTLYRFSKKCGYQPVMMALFFFIVKKLEQRYKESFVIERLDYYMGYNPKPSLDQIELESALRSAGFAAHGAPLKRRGKKYIEKGLDSQTTQEITLDADHGHFDILILCAGDEDLESMVQKLKHYSIPTILVTDRLKEASTFYSKKLADSAEEVISFSRTVKLNPGLYKLIPVAKPVVVVQKKLPVKKSQVMRMALAKPAVQSKPGFVVRKKQPQPIVRYSNEKPHVGVVRKKQTVV